MTKELDDLMNLDPTELTSADIDRIVEHQRQARLNYEAGIKPKKAEGPKVALTNVMAALTGKKEVPVAKVEPKAEPTPGEFKRRV